MKVLLIENNQDINREMRLCLSLRYIDGIIVSVGKGLKGVEVLETESFDLIIADSSLPDIDRLDLITKIRELFEGPLIIISEDKMSNMDVAECFEAGADEYVTTPFSPIELLARVKALFRRTHGLSFQTEHLVNINNELKINFTIHEVSRLGKRVES
jgi:two-component system KDP operon response regulator KdpE